MDVALEDSGLIVLVSHSLVLADAVCAALDTTEERPKPCRGAAALAIALLLEPTSTAPTDPADPDASTWQP